MIVADALLRFTRSLRNAGEYMKTVFVGSFWSRAAGVGELYAVVAVVAVDVVRRDRLTNPESDARPQMALEPLSELRAILGARLSARERR
ncbi:MAG: hypothetical protein R3B09_10370 [Nannocystaceae bacterium]